MFKRRAYLIGPESPSECVISALYDLTCAMKHKIDGKIPDVS